MGRSLGCTGIWRLSVEGAWSLELGVLSLELRTLSLELGTLSLELDWEISCQSDEPVGSER